MRVSILLENESGALSRGGGLSQRGYSIESLTVAPADDQSIIAYDYSDRGR